MKNIKIILHFASNVFLFVNKEVKYFCDCFDAGGIPLQPGAPGEPRAPAAVGEPGAPGSPAGPGGPGAPAAGTPGAPTPKSSPTKRKRRRELIAELDWWSKYHIVKEDHAKVTVLHWNQYCFFDHLYDYCK